MKVEPLKTLPVPEKCHVCRVVLGTDLVQQYYTTEDKIKLLQPVKCKESYAKQHLITRDMQMERAEVPQKILPEIAAERRPRLRVNPASVVPRNPLQNDVALQHRQNVTS